MISIPKPFAAAALFALHLALLPGCVTKTRPPAAKPVAAPFLQAFQARGSIQELKPDGVTTIIRHEEIPGYMPAMVTPFRVKNAKELKGLAAGDTVSFQLIVSADDGWIEQVVKLDAPDAPPDAAHSPR